MPNEKLVLLEIGETKFPTLESYSPFVVKVHRTLKALGLPYERQHGAHPGVFKKYNVARQVPVLLVGDRAVVDSTLIMIELQKLAGRSLEGSGDPRERGEIWLWEELADTSLYGFVLASRWADDRNWPRTKESLLAGMPGPVRAIFGPGIRRKIIANVVARDVWRAGPEAAWARFERLLDDFELRAPAEGYWVGGSLSVADIAIFAQLHSLRNEITAWQAVQIANRPRLTAYLDRVHAETES